MRFLAPRPWSGTPPWRLWLRRGEWIYLTNRNVVGLSPLHVVWPGKIVLYRGERFEVLRVDRHQQRVKVRPA